MSDGSSGNGGRLIEPVPSDIPPRIDDCGVLRYRGAWTALSPTQEAVLRTLVNRFGEPVSRTAITAEVWPDGGADRHTIDIHIHRLRPRLRAIGLVIHTLRGRGFLLEGSTD